MREMAVKEEPAAKVVGVSAMERARVPGRSMDVLAQGQVDVAGVTMFIEMTRYTTEQAGEQFQTTEPVERANS
ncbi:MAG: hypothetical protein K6T78_00885 [Alicyclobacillus sp.]|nr:hypothetical protein [Alicyclobacillus sp.]